MRASTLAALLAAFLALAAGPAGTGPDAVAAEYTWNGVEWVWNEDVREKKLFPNLRRQ